MRKRANESACCSKLETWLSPELFKALGDPNRLTILTRLASRQGEEPVSDIAQCCEVDLSVVSRHLRILRDAGVLQARRCGKQVHYSLRVGHLVGLLRGLADSLEACCPEKS